MRTNTNNVSIKSAISAVLEIERLAKRDWPHPRMVHEINGQTKRVPANGFLWCRIFQNIKFEGGHWLWIGTKNHLGYGRISIHGENFPAHKVLYTVLFGEFDDSLELDHLCRIRDCVNPYHLEPVTHRVNMLRGETVPAKHASKTHCAKGHPYDEKNTHFRKNGARSCRGYALHSLIHRCGERTKQNTNL